MLYNKCYYDIITNISFSCQCNPLIEFSILILSLLLVFAIKRKFKLIYFKYKQRVKFPPLQKVQREGVVPPRLFKFPSSLVGILNAAAAPGPKVAHCITREGRRVFISSDQSLQFSVV